ncbi:hypothetical protein HNV12_06540 [Methanococcoides sp. SA1]|nr:hypothetical protein [Methanococcoides sp. SA1]
MIEKDERIWLYAFALLVFIELSADLSLAQIPIAGDLANTLGDGVLNLGELGIAIKMAMGNNGEDT